MHVALVDELDVLDRAVVAVEHLHVVALNAARLLGDALVLRGDAALEEALPLLVGKVKPFSSSSWRRRLATSCPSEANTTYS